MWAGYRHNLVRRYSSLAPVSSCDLFGDHVENVIECAILCRLVCERARRSVCHEIPRCKPSDAKITASLALRLSSELLLLKKFPPRCRHQIGRRSRYLCLIDFKCREFRSAPVRQPPLARDCTGLGERCSACGSPGPRGMCVMPQPRLASDQNAHSPSALPRVAFHSWPASLSRYQCATFRPFIEHVKHALVYCFGAFACEMERKLGIERCRFVWRFARPHEGPNLIDTFLDVADYRHCFAQSSDVSETGISPANFLIDFLHRPPERS